MSNFVILSSKRSGSTYLVSALNNHPEISCTGEIFKAINPLRIILPEYSYFHTQNESIGNRIRHYLNREYVTKLHLDKLYKRNKDENIIGFKLMPRQITRFPATIPYLREKNIKAIALIRKNLIDRLVSTKRAVKTKTFGTKNIDRAKKVTLKLDPKTIIKDLELLDSDTQRIKSNAALFNHILINYDDLFSLDSTIIQKKISEFLDVNFHPLKSKQTKIIKNPVSRVVENYDEIYPIIKNSRFNIHLVD